MKRGRALLLLALLGLAGCIGMPRTTEVLLPVAPEIPQAVIDDIRMWRDLVISLVAW